MPVPSWLTVPAPEMAADTVVLLLWLKLITPVPSPKAMVGALIVPAPSLVPKRPIFSVPVSPASTAIVMPPAAATVPPLATVRVPPAAPLNRPPPTFSVPLLVQSEPAPVTKAVLLVPRSPMKPRALATVPPLETTKLLLLPLTPTVTSPPLVSREPASVTVTEF